jgi:hypothetical protein
VLKLCGGLRRIGILAFANCKLLEKNQNKTKTANH